MRKVTLVIEEIADDTWSMATTDVPYVAMECLIHAFFKVMLERWGFEDTVRVIMSILQDADKEVTK